MGKQAATQMCMNSLELFSERTQLLSKPSFIAQENARRHQTEFPLAAETVLQSTYMDDSLDSVEEDEKGVELYHQLNALWAKAGMHARKWVSNSATVMAAIPEDDRATEVNIRDSKDTVTTTLGLQWNSTDDVLAVPATPVPEDYPITKRSVLKKIATVFDPLGLVSPFVVQAKIMLQELWNRGYDWDEEVQDEVANRPSGLVFTAVMPSKCQDSAVPAKPATSEVEGNGDLC